MPSSWIPKSQITGPIPLAFQHQIYDTVVEDKLNRMVYLGFRPNTSFEAHQQFYNEGKNYPFYQFHLCKSQFLSRFFRKYYSDYDFDLKRPTFTPNQTSELQFDSNFEGGNLDAAYYEQEEYRLLLRVDSNTLGHCNYFNFKVKVKKMGKYTFRIMNINKQKSLYERGMRPYIKRISPLPTEFQQDGRNVRFVDSPLNEQYQLDYPLKSCKFQYEFSENNSVYHFSYCIPFTYSDLMADIRKTRGHNNLHVGKLCHTLSGIEIPLLTIANSQKQQFSKDPFVIVIMGRVHPSQANGSHIVNGVIKQLLSDCAQTSYLKNRVVFKIIPMINPDGVIIGNTRTSFAGKDLNRKYSKNSEFVFPQVIGIIDYVAKLKSKYGDKLLFLIDIHGHSARKNSFFFGPQFPIIDEEYLKCRLLPRFYAKTTDIFRYHSCKFRMATDKQHTARGYFNSNSIRTYTHETSMHCFFDFNTRKDLPFTRLTLEKLGRDLILSLHDYIKQTIPNRPEDKIEITPIQVEEKAPPRVKGINYSKEDDGDSEKLSSNGADSEDEGEDFQEKHLMQFYSKINVNKEYFYEELLAQQNSSGHHNPSTKEDKTRIKKYEMRVNQYSRGEEKNKQRIEEELVVKKNNERIDWASKAIYPERKRNFQQYGKLSSVIFGSNVHDSYGSREHHRQGSEQLNAPEQFRSTKYTIKCMDAQFTTNKPKFPSPEPKIYRSQKQMERGQQQKTQTESQEQFSKNRDQSRDLEKRKYEKYLEVKEQALIKIRAKAASKEDIDRLLSTKPVDYQYVKPLPICAVDLGLMSQDKRKEEKQIFRMTTSLKVLTRKKSIKNIKDSDQMASRKITKSLKLTSLTKKLPSINFLATKF